MQKSVDHPTAKARFSTQSLPRFDVKHEAVTFTAPVKQVAVVSNDGGSPYKKT